MTIPWKDCFILVSDLLFEVLYRVSIRIVVQSCFPSAGCSQGLGTSHGLLLAGPLSSSWRTRLPQDHRLVSNFVPPQSKGKRAFRTLFQMPPVGRQMSESPGPLVWWSGGGHTWGSMNLGLEHRASPFESWSCQNARLGETRSMQHGGSREDGRALYQHCGRAGHLVDIEKWVWEKMEEGSRTVLSTW